MDIDNALVPLGDRISMAESVIEQHTTDISLRVLTSTYNSKMSSLDSSISSLQSRVNAAELKITDSAIVSTVRSSTSYKSDLDAKVSTNSIISTINQSAESITIQANKIGLLGETNIPDLTADKIKGGTLTLGGLNNGELVVKGSDNANILSVTKTGLSLKEGTLQIVGSNVTDWSGDTVQPRTIINTSGIYFDYEPNGNRTFHASFSETGMSISSYDPFSSDDYSVVMGVTYSQRHLDEYFYPWVLQIENKLQDNYVIGNINTPLMEIYGGVFKCNIPAEFCTLKAGEIGFAATPNSGAAMIGRANDRVNGTLTVQLGNNGGSGQKFEIVDSAWTKVLFSVDNGGNGSFNGDIFIKPLGWLTNRIDSSATANNSDWLYPTFLNGWQNYETSSWNGAAYRKDNNGFVHLRGLIRNGALGTIAFNLPAGFRPPKEVILIAASYQTFCIVTVGSTGNVTIGAYGTGSSSFTSLEGLTLSGQSYKEEDTR